jgi:hypothetical protein
MKKVQRATAFLLPLLFLPLALPPAALAFETVDTLPWPSRGRFPAYAPEPLMPFELWVQGGVLRDDNILRRQSGGESDWVGRIGAGFRSEQRIVGRQRLHLEGRVDGYSHYNFDNLDHVAYAGLADWRWEVGNDLAGSINAGREERQADISQTQTARRDAITLTHLAANGAWRLGPSTRLRAGVGTAWGERSTRPDVKTHGVATTVGADYVTTRENTFGLEYRHSRGDAPVPETIAPLGTFVNNSYVEEEVAFVVGYSPQPALRSEWRLGRTNRSYNELQGRDFKGTTYRMHVEWLPGMKTILALDAYREPRSLLDVSASHVLLTGVGFGPSWAVTAKTVLSARVLRERRQFQGDPSIELIGAPLRDEIVYAYRFGIGWEPARQWQVSAAVDHGTRESNFFGRNYHYTAVMTNLAWRY